jgi:hypothetical protein
MWQVHSCLCSKCFLAIFDHELIDLAACKAKVMDKYERKLSSTENGAVVRGLGST